MTGLWQVEPRCSLVAHSCQIRQVFLTIVKNPSSYRRWPLHMQRFAFASPRFFLAAVVLLFLRFASAAELHVPSQHSTIQAAIDGAAGGDVVLVAPGIYSERIVLKADVTLRSVGDDAKGAIGLRRAEATIIDGGGDTKPEAGVEMAEAATLDGFTIRHVGVYDEAEWQKHFKRTAALRAHWGSRCRWHLGDWSDLHDSQQHRASCWLFRDRNSWRARKKD